MTLEQLGLTAGHKVRFRRRDAGRWHVGAAERVEQDGSLRVRDGKGAARAIPLALVEVRAEGPRGATRWEPLLERAARIEQLRLL
ncbi:MAG TPA: hypothetical protein VFA94_09550 [Acidimicrobiales bacterium]|nr:hypothetical protein [Acidimicrobiales bacterium]